VDEGELMQEASTYYANILMPLWRSVSRALKALEGVQVEVIAPSHGVIWRKDPGRILGLYQRWVAGETGKRAVVVYDTMWEHPVLARAIVDGMASKGVEVRLHCLGASPNSVMSSQISSRLRQSSSAHYVK
jgi:flavorubredoxin